MGSVGLKKKGGGLQGPCRRGPGQDGDKGKFTKTFRFLDQRVRFDEGSAAIYGI